jgi:hypothetical protein
MDRIEFFVGHFRVVPMATVPWDHGISGMAAPLPGLMEHRTGLAVAGIFWAVKTGDFSAATGVKWPIRYSVIPKVRSCISKIVLMYHNTGVEFCWYVLEIQWSRVVPVPISRKRVPASAKSVPAQRVQNGWGGTNFSVTWKSHIAKRFSMVLVASPR